MTDQSPDQSPDQSTDQSTDQNTTRPTGYVYVDCEATGLDRRRHDAYELAWAVDDGPIHTLLLPHRLRYADPIALKVGGYHHRNIPGRYRFGEPDVTVADFVAAFANPDGTKRTLVAANPAYDAGMLHGKVVGREPLRTRLARGLRLPAAPAPTEPWHYRMLDIEAYAAGTFGWASMRGLARTRDECVRLGYLIPLPDHTAAGDVATLRAVHYACWDYLGRPWGLGLAPRADRAGGHG